MGINLNADFELFVKGKKSFKEYSGKNILMLGKQVPNFNVETLYETLSKAQFEWKQDIIDISDRDIFKCQIDSYDLFKLLGFSEVHALDVSDYENADIILDLACKEIPMEYHKKFDYVLDGGTLEHVFNVIQALVNIHKMVKVGGTVIHVLPCEGWCDHGFYSFSPTALLDFYNHNGYFVNQSFLFGYKYPDVDFPVIVSPDCRFIDCDKWIHAHRNNFRFNLVFAANKFKDIDNLNLNFTQYHWEKFFNKCEEDQVRYDYDVRLEILKQDLNEGKHIGIYGTGETAMETLNILRGGVEMGIQGVYEPKKGKGDVVDFIFTKKCVLAIDEVVNDGIDCIFVASKKKDVIDIVRQRIAGVKKYGVKII